MAENIDKLIEWLEDMKAWCAREAYDEDAAACDETIAALRTRQARISELEAERDAARESLSNLPIADDVREFWCNLIPIGGEIGEIEAVAQLEAFRGRAVLAEREWAENAARRYARCYPDGSDGRNTFTMLADAIRARSNTDTGPQALTTAQAQGE